MNFDTKRGFWQEHAPGAVLDYGFDWKSAGWLQTGETITGSTWDAPDQVTLSNPQHSAETGKTSTFATGCKAGFEYRLTNTITTSAGRIDSRSITLVCVAR